MQTIEPSSIENFIKTDYTEMISLLQSKSFQLLDDLLSEELKEVFYLVNRHKPNTILGQNECISVYAAEQDLQKVVIIRHDIDKAYVSELIFYKKDNSQETVGLSKDRTIITIAKESQKIQKANEELELSALELILNFREISNQIGFNNAREQQKENVKKLYNQFYSATKDFGQVYLGKQAYNKIIEM